MHKDKRQIRRADNGVFDDQHQLFFPDGEKFDADKYRKFAKWRNANQPAIDWLVNNLDALKQYGRGYCSADNVIALLRDRCPFRIRQTDPHFKVSNNISPYLMRHVVYKRPHVHLFEFAPAKKRHCPTCTCNKHAA